jgi:hypothetical protein
MNALVATRRWGTENAAFAYRHIADFVAKSRRGYWQALLAGKGSLSTREAQSEVYTPTVSHYPNPGSFFSALGWWFNALESGTGRNSNHDVLKKSAKFAMRRDDSPK